MKPKVCIDAGHGGTESGIIAYGLVEKDICLDIANYVREYLSDWGVEGILTRSTDTTLSWQDRIQRGEKEQAEVMISLHMNGSFDEQESGFESVISGCAGLEERCLQAWLHNHVAAFLRGYRIWDRGKKYDSTGAFPLLEKASCPTIHLSLLHLTHPEEKSWCRHQYFREELAYAIAEGSVTLLQEEFRR